MPAPPPSDDDRRRARAEFSAEQTKRVHLLGVAGTGMGAFAGLLKADGFSVSGSDQNVYPPMSDKLQEWGIDVRTPYAPENLHDDPDLVVVGNVIRRDNVEAAAVREKDLLHTSFPAAFSKLFLEGRRSVVVAGTHGKTTTSTLLAWSLFDAGMDPGFLIGGIPTNAFETPGGDESDAEGESFRVGARTEETAVVVEGDEYDTAYFDKGPKFLHYRPEVLLVTSLEYDHADIYADVDEIVQRFVQLFSLVPAHGQIFVRKGQPHIEEALAQAEISARVLTYGDDGDWRAADFEEGPEGIAFTPSGPEGVGAMERVRLDLSGEHNADNALGAFAVLHHLGVAPAEIARVYGRFRGVKRRMERKGEGDGVLVIDDFAHHPTAVKTTLWGAKRRFGDRPLYALFEPRSATSCRKIFQEDYARAFDACDRLFLAPPGRQLDKSEALDVDKLAFDVDARGTKATAAPDLETLVNEVVAEVPKGAVILAMSNGAFGLVPSRLVTALQARENRK